LGSSTSHFIQYQFARRHGVLGYPKQIALSRFCFEMTRRVTKTRRAVNLAEDVVDEHPIKVLVRRLLMNYYYIDHNFMIKYVLYSVSRHYLNIYSLLFGRTVR
jgi:hypothetical protein